MEPIRSISSLFAPPAKRDAPAAIVGGKQIKFKELERDVAALSAQLRTRPEARWLLLSEDAYAIAVGLLATLYAERIVVLPANLQPGHIDELSHRIDGILAHEQGVSSVARVLPIFGHDLPTKARTLGPFDTSRAEVVLHTSGTTGTPVPVHKSVRCLEAELAVLMGLFEHSEPYVVRATVPAHHVYGLLFRVLWPLLAAQPFVAETLRYPEELERACENSKGNILISSPAFLARALDVLDLDVVKDGLAGLFSSGGPLPCEVAAAYSTTLAKPVIEIYGSTETGGIGYRAWLNATQPEPLNPLPGITLSVNSDSEDLSVSSPFLHNMDSFQTGDRARLLPDGRFELLGRSDRIVKIEERRISLVEVEKILAARSEISSVQVELLEGRTGRKFLSAVIVPTAEGWSALTSGGKRALTNTLRAALTPYLDLVALPRKWRFVKKTPETVKGTSALSQFRAMFGLADDVTRPILLDRTASRSALLLKMKLPTDLDYFDGHFDSYPILPGVIQLDWAVKFARDEFPLDGMFQRIEALKFFRVLSAGEEVTLKLRFDAKKELLHFQYDSDQHKHSAGRIQFGAAA